MVIFTYLFAKILMNTKTVHIYRLLYFALLKVCRPSKMGYKVSLLLMVDVVQN